jgi:hypothetical protein
MSFDLNPALFTYPELNASRLDLEPERRTELGWPEELAHAGQQLGNVTLSPP